MLSLFPECALSVSCGLSRGRSGALIQRQILVAGVIIRSSAGWFEAAAIVFFRLRVRPKILPVPIIGQRLMIAGIWLR
jgi:hypothetical protein